MKILWVFSTFAIGGPQRRAALLIETLESGHEHVIVAQDDRWEALQFLPKGARWRALKQRFEKSSLVSLANLRLIRGLLREIAPDLLLTSNFGTIEWAIANRGRRRIPHIHFEDGFGPDESPDRQNWKRALARRLFLSDRLVAVPSTVLEKAALERWKLPRRQVRLLPNGIDVDGYAPPLRREGPVVVGSLGALRAEKNYPRLVRAVAEAARVAPELSLVLHGDGDQKEAIAREAAACGFAGLHLPGPTMEPAKALAAIDIFALSSDTEQTPISLMEAMAAGLPAAATDVGDIARMVSAENRPFIVPLGDDAALACAIAALAGDANLRSAIGAANREKARAEFGLDRMAAAHRALYEEAR